MYHSLEDRKVLKEYLKEKGINFDINKYGFSDDEESQACDEIMEELDLCYGYRKNALGKKELIIESFGND